MARHFRENQFRGVNPHLNSLLQQPKGGWLGFHNTYLIHIKIHLNTILPTGYYADNEESLQIARLDTESGIETPRYSRPDVLIYHDPHTSTDVPLSNSVSAAPVLSLPLSETIVTFDYYDSVVIYFDEEGQLIPVTRLELLSPANKPPNANYPHYMANRNETLYRGVRLVELDFLHTQRPLLSSLAHYPHDAGAYPYTILVSDPYPTLDAGRLDVYGFGVDTPIPTIQVPLLNQQTVAVDFNPPYQLTYANTPSYGMVRVDYERLPVEFERYTADDQAKIRARLATIQQGTADSE